MIWALEPSCTNPRNFRPQPADQVTMARVNLTDSISAFRACFNIQLLVISFHHAEFIRLSCLTALEPPSVAPSTSNVTAPACMCVYLVIRVQYPF